MEIRKLVVGLFATNCYLLVEKTKVIVIDPGSSFRRIKEEIDKIDNAEVKAILLTHGHLDHIGAVDRMVKQYKCPVYACRDDERILTDADINSLADMSATVESKISWLTGNHLKIDDFDFDILYTPGHTAGSVMYLSGMNLFSGDTLFKQSVGRTDLYSGSDNQLHQSLQIIRTLNPDITVYPGHEDITTIAEELKNNPYL